MPARLVPPLEEEFILERTDKSLNNEEDPTTVKIKQASQGEHDQRMDLWSKFDKRFNLNEDEIVVSQNVSPAEIRRKEVFLTMTDCNIEAADGKPLFKFPLEWKAFKAAWAKLPTVAAEEIHEKVLSVNISWMGNSPSGETP